MHINLFDGFQDRSSPLHRLDPRMKVVLAAAFILTVVLLPDAAWLAFLLAWALVLAANRLAGLAWTYTLRRSFIALPFALAAVSVVFTLPGPPLASFNLGPLHLTASTAGIERFLTILLRSWLSVQAAILLTAATSFPDLLHALRHLQIPTTLVAIIAFMYRYLFVVADETGRLLRARASRSASPARGKGGGAVLWRARVAGGLAGQLFLRSFDRSDRVYNAMLARGFTGEFRTLNPHQLHWFDWTFSGIALGLMLLLLAFGRLAVP